MLIPIEIFSYYVSLAIGLNLLKLDKRKTIFSIYISNIKAKPNFYQSSSFIITTPNPSRSLMIISINQLTELINFNSLKFEKD